MKKPRNLSARFLSLGFLVLSATTALNAEENAKDESNRASQISPWGFNLSMYTWLPGIYGNFSAGGHSGSVDVNFIDIVDKSRRIPLGFMGRFEAHYERFGFYLDGNYMDINLRPKFGRISDGVDTELGLMDYGLMYRIFGATAAEIAGMTGRKRPNALEVYAGARALWLGNSVSISGPFGLIGRTPSTNNSYTSPILGLRFMVDFTPNWFVLADGNFGGFGAQQVDFTGGILGTVGYRTTLFDIPSSFEAGYKAVRYRVDKNGPNSASATLDGPFIGMTGHW